MLTGPTHHDPMRLVDPRHLPQLMSLEDHELTLVEGTLVPHNATPAGEEGASGQQHQPFPWVVTVLAGVLITTIVVDVIGNLLVIVSVFRNRKLRKAGKSAEREFTQSLVFYFHPPHVHSHDPYHPYRSWMMVVINRKYMFPTPAPFSATGTGVFPFSAFLLLHFIYLLKLRCRFILTIQTC